MYNKRILPAEKSKGAKKMEITDPKLIEAATAFQNLPTVIQDSIIETLKDLLSEREESSAPLLSTGKKVE